MSEREQYLREAINTRRQQIADGVSLERKESMEQEVLAFEEELAGLTQEVAELPPEGEPTEPAEPILATVDGLPLEVFTRNEDAAILIRCEVESLIENINKAHVVVIGGLNNRLQLAYEMESVLRQRNAELERDYEICANENKEMVEENVKLVQSNHDLTLERDQALLYRDNAVKQLEDMAFELEQNRIELNRNREVRVLTEAERTAEQEAARQRFLDSRIKIYNPRNADELNSRERIANLAETGEEITYLAIYEKGTYIEITEDEALAIRAMNKPIEMPEVAEEAIFPADPSTEESILEGEQGIEQQNSGDNESTVSEDAGPESFEDEVRRRLTTLELKVNKNEPVVIHELAF